MKNTKRILSVTIERMSDDSPDTFYLGEYSSKSTSDYSIDRKHSTDCNDQTFSEAREFGKSLSRAADYINAQIETLELAIAEPSSWEPLEQAIELLLDASDECTECSCGESGDMGRNEYRFFNPVIENYKGLEPSEIRKYCLQDYERMERLNAGFWSYLGIRAQAEVTVDEGITQKITSGGIWGIESDSNRDYLKSTEQEELAELRKQLLGLEFSRHQVYRAFKRAEHSEA